MSGSPLGGVRAVRPSGGSQLEDNETHSGATAPPLTGGDFQESSHTAKSAVYVDQKNVGCVVLAGASPHSKSNLPAVGCV